jgi:hypothetical protein
MIHPEVKKIYEKHYGKMSNDVPRPSVDDRFLEDISEYVIILERIVKRHVNGNNSVE